MLEHQILKIVDEAQPAKMTEATPDANTPAVMMSKKKSIKKTISKEDKFFVNMGFRSKLRRIQINALQKKETR